MKMYKVYVVDKFTKCPLITYEVEALTRWHAKRKVARQYDKTYLIIAARY